MNKTILAGLCALLVAAGTTHGQSTAFTYQGRLNTVTSAATGLYDFSFNLYATNSGGSALTASNVVVAVPVTNGLFAVTLDFGNQFPGADRWLGIAVRTNGGGTFATLAPRQPLTPTPYAIRAAFAGTATSATSATSAGTAANVAPGGVNNAALANGAVDSSKIADGSIAVSDLSGVVLSNTFWRLTGNANTTPGVNFLGTIDNQAMEVKVNNARVLRMEPTTGTPNLIGGFSNNFVAAGIVGATIGGGGSAGSGNSNRISSDLGTIGGGIRNSIQTNAGRSTIGGGEDNTIQAGADQATIAGGNSGTIQSRVGAIGGGSINLIQSNASHATIAGGEGNAIRSGADHAVIGGGFQNSVGTNAPFGMVPGGRDNIAGGAYSLAAGRRANAAHDGTFVWADSQNASFPSTASNQFLVRASGGVGIGTPTPHGALEVNTGAGSFIFRNELGVVPSLSIADSPNAGVLRFRNRFEIWPNDAGTASGALDVRNATGTTTVNLPGSGDGYFTAGKFGIGKTDPATALDVNGTVTASQFNGPLNGNLSGTFNGGVSASSFKLGSSSTAGSVLTASDGAGNATFESNLRVFPAFLLGDNGNIAAGRYNGLSGGVSGAVIAGGGSSGSPNQVTGNFGAVGGGRANSAGNFGTVPGGEGNSSAGQYSFAAGRRAKANHQGTFVWADSQSSDFASTGNNQFLIRALSGVGINTPSPGIGYSLDVNGTAQIRNTLVVDGDNANDGSIYPGLSFGPNSGEGICSRRTSGDNQYGLDFYTDFQARLSVDQTGKIGMGTTTPAGALLDVEGDVRINDHTLHLRGGSDPSHGLGYSSTFAGQGVDGPALYGWAGGVLGTKDGGDNWSLRWNKTEVRVKVLTIEGGADVAEPFPMKGDEIEPGSVMVIDDEQPGHLKLSARFYDTRVAGIVSGAGGVQPGLALHQQGVLEGDKNVALSGRVYVKADATQGAIRPGDLLTTSERLGHAMKAADPTRSQGAILGKAMSALPDGTGLVLVLVTLQ